MVIVLLILSAALLSVWYTRHRHGGKEIEPKERICAESDGNQPRALTLNPAYAGALQPTSTYGIVPEFAPVYVTTEFAPVYVTAEAEAARGALANPTYEAAELRATADATVAEAETHGAALANPTYEAMAADPGLASSAAPSQIVSSAPGAYGTLVTAQQYGTLVTAQQHQAHAYATLGTGQGSGDTAPAQQQSDNPAESSSNVYQDPYISQDQSVPQYAVFGQGSGKSAGPAQHSDESVDAPADSNSAPSAYGSLGTADQHHSQTYAALATGQGSDASADPAQLNGYDVVDTDSIQDQPPQYAVVDEGGSSHGSGDPEYASVEYAYQDADETSSSTGDHGVYAVPSPAGNSRLGMQVVRVAEDGFC